MFKLVVAFGLIVTSAADEDISNFELSRHAELSMNQTNQIMEESAGKFIKDSVKTQQLKPPNRHDQRTQPFIWFWLWFWKWSLTNNSCSHSAVRPAQPSYSEDLTMSVSVSVQRQEDSNQNKSEKIVKVKTSHSREKREGTMLKNNLEMNLLDDWIENKVKVPHISHIYIGESMYPYMYEESRIIQSEAHKQSSGEDSRVKEVKISETRRKKEEEAPVYDITKIYEIK